MNQPELDRLYIGAKLIRAYPMDHHTFLKTQAKEPGYGELDNQLGYHVLYPDGYESWSPKAVFENAYREVTEGEKILF